MKTGKTTMAQRALCALLVMLLAAVCLPFGAFAEESETQYATIVLSAGEHTSITISNELSKNDAGNYLCPLETTITINIQVEDGYTLSLAKWDFVPTDDSKGGAGDALETVGTHYLPINAVGTYTITTAAEETAEAGGDANDANGADVGENAVSSLDNWQEVLFDKIGFASAVGGGSDPYFEEGTAAPAGTVFWFLNLTTELNACVDGDGYVNVAYETYMNIAKAYFVNAPEMKDYLSEYMDSTGLVRYYLGGLGDYWAWILCESEACDGGYKLKGIFCSGLAEDTTGLTENVDYYVYSGTPMEIASAIELYVKKDAVHGWRIAAYSKLDNYTLPILKYTTEDKSVSVVVSEEDAEFFEGKTLVVESLDSENENTAFVVQKLGDDLLDAQVLDIHFEDEDDQPVPVTDTKMTVTVAVPDGWGTDPIAVYYVNTKSGEMTNMNAVMAADGKTLSFVTNHFSCYALVRMKDAAPSTGDNTPVEETKKAPATGDEGQIALWAALTLASCAALGGAAYGRKKTRG